MTFPPLRFRACVTLGIAVIVLAFGAVLALVVSQAASTALREEITRKGSEEARDTARKAIDPLLGGDFLRLRNIVDEVTSGNTDVTYAFILDSSGRVLAHTFQDGFPAELASVNLPSPGRDEAMVLVDSGQALIYDFAALAEVDGVPLGAARVGYSRDKVSQVANRLLTTVLMTTLLAMAVASVLGAAFAKALAARVLALKARTETILGMLTASRPATAPQGSPEQAVRPPDGDEIVELTRAFETMLSAVQERETERDRALAALRESEQRWQFALEGSDEGVWDWNVQTGQVYFSPHWKAMLGYADHELGQDFTEWEDRLHPDDRLKAHAGIQNHLEGNTPAYRLEHRLRCKDGSWKWILARGKVMARDAQGRPLRMIGTHADISERIRMQEVMIQTEKMLSVGGLAAGMAHEINNPLGGILQGVQVISRRLEPGARMNQETAARTGCGMDGMLAYLKERGILEMLEMIRDSGVRAAKTVANMLEFSRQSDSGKEPVDLGALLDKAVTISANDYDLRKRFDFRKIEIRRDYDPDLGQVSCSPIQIEQVALNIIRNAAQAMAQLPPGAPLVITLGVRREPGFARIDIGDTGPGMDEAVRKRIFEPFFTTKPPGVGTGLGLSVSYFIVTQNHGGTIEAASAPGQGTTFTIRLPLGKTT